MSGDISGGPAVRGVGAGKIAAQHPTTHRADTTAPLRPTTKNYLVPNDSVAKVENSFPRVSILRVTQKFLI